MVTQVCSQSDTAGLFLSHQGQCTTKPSLSLRYFKNNFSLKDKMSVFHVQLLGAFHYDKLTGQRSKGILEENGTSQPIVMVLIIKFILHTLFTHFTHFIFFFLQQNNLDYVDPQIANLLFEAGQSSTNIGYNI